MLAPEIAPHGAERDPSTPDRVLRGILQLGNQASAHALAQITSGRAGYHLGLAMFCLSQSMKRRWPSTGVVPRIWAIPTNHAQVEAGADTQKNPPPRATTPLHLRVPRRPQDPPGHGP